MRDVEVGEIRPENPHFGRVPERTDHGLLVEAQQPETIEHVRREPAALSRQIKKPEVPPDPRIAELKFRHVIDDAIAPFELSRIDRLRQSGTQKSLRGRADLEDRIARHRVGFRSILDAERVRVNQLVAVDDANSDSRHIGGLHSCADVAFKGRDKRVDACLHIGSLLRHCRGAGCQERCRKAGRYQFDRIHPAPQGATGRFPPYRRCHAHRDRDPD